MSPTATTRLREGFRSFVDIATVVIAMVLHAARIMNIDKMAGQSYPACRMEGRAMTTLRAAILALVIGLGLGTAVVPSASMLVVVANDRTHWASDDGNRFGSVRRIK